MRLFQMKVEVNGRDRIEDFLEHNYVCIGPAGIGDLEQLGEAELMRRLAAIARNEQHLAELYKEMHLFVREMQDGDYILLQDNGTVYLGDLGDYYYVESYDSEEETSCHRRGVTWLTSVPAAGIGNEMRALLNEEAAISSFGSTLSQAELQAMLGGGVDDREAGSADSNPLPRPHAGMVAEALAILQEAMRSDDAERRERAAIAVLGYASGANSARA